MSVIDEYLRSVDQPQRTELERIRRLVKQLVPDAEEVIAYGMPVFKFNKKYLIGFAPFKDHMSLFPGPESIAHLKDELNKSKLKLSKGTIQFTLDNPISDKLIEKIVKDRLKDIKKQLQL